jgi:hypothetical protein
MNPWILTASGKVFDLAEPTADMVDRGDLAQALSQIVRWNGHQKGLHITVAEHSVRVAELVMTRARAGEGDGYRRLVLAALLHDAHEAYLGDISSPVKALLGRELVEACERRIDAAIAERFGFDPELMRHPDVKSADVILLATEARDLMPKSPREWLPKGVVPLEEVLEPEPDIARRRFLSLLARLT